MWSLSVPFSLKTRMTRADDSLVVAKLTGEMFECYRKIQEQLQSDIYKHSQCFCPRNRHFKDKDMELWGFCYAVEFRIQMSRMFSHEPHGQKWLCHAFLINVHLGWIALICSSGMQTSDQLLHLTDHLSSSNPFPRYYTKTKTIQNNTIRNKAEIK